MSILSKTARVDRGEPKEVTDVPFYMKVNDKPSDPEWEELCKLLNIDPRKAGGSYAGITLLQEAGLGDLVPERASRAEGESDSVVVGLRLPDREKVAARIKEVTGEEIDPAGRGFGADCFRAVFRHFCKVKGIELPKA